MPKTTKSMHIALHDLQLNKLAVMYPGKEIFPLTEQITAYGLETIGTGAFMRNIQLPIGLSD